MAKSPQYQARFYRDWVAKAEGKGLFSFSAVERETDLFIRADRNLSSKAAPLVRNARREIEEYIRAHNEFLTSLSPLPMPTDATGIPLEMLRASTIYNVGPMAAVAGAIAEHVGRGLIKHTGQVIVENGGDVFLQLDRPAVMRIYCGENSPFGEGPLIEVGGGDPVGVCTSSGVVGHSLSMGKADAVTAVADSAALADAAATSIANRIKIPEDIQRVIEEENGRGHLRGLLAVMGATLGVWGEIRMIKG